MNAQKEVLRVICSIFASHALQIVMNVRMVTAAEYARRVFFWMMGNV